MLRIRKLFYFFIIILSFLGCAKSDILKQNNEIETGKGLLNIPYR